MILCDQGVGVGSPSNGGEALLDQPKRLVTNPALCEPFQNGRQTGRLLHDLGAMLSLLSSEMLSYPVLDFGAGSGWITETLAKMGLSVTAFDIHGDLEGCIAGRVSADSRINPSLITIETGDGHAMPFADASFGHLLCYDTLHHMRDYNIVFREFERVLRPGGRAIFVEPGARHSRSRETIAFLEGKKHDPTWIERDVVLKDIDQCARSVGFGELNIVPLQHPNRFKVFSARAWLRYRRGDPVSRYLFSRHLARINYHDQIVFYCEKLAR
jgi:SAM-dependent methyltransferase